MAMPFVLQGEKFVERDLRRELLPQRRDPPNGSESPVAAAPDAGNELRHRPTMPGDRHRFAPFHPVQEFRKMSLGLKGAYFVHRMPTVWGNR